VSREDPPKPHAEKKPNAVVIVATTLVDDPVATLAIEYTMDGPTLAINSQTCKLVVTSEFRLPVMAREWGFPAGLIDEGESPEEAAIREFKEETGLCFVPRETSAPNLYSSAGMTLHREFLMLKSVVRHVLCHKHGAKKGDL
jgi:8-oxo-dGTP pyrophosphatase MutT (NUDIX family)